MFQEERRPRPAIENKAIDPGKVFDLTLPLDQAAEGYGPWTNGAPSGHC
jgi:hypothetical protein